MFRKTPAFILIFILSLSTIQVARADEGMWLLSLLKKLNYQDMKENGLKLSPEEIYSVNNSSIKDAVVRLNGGSCTASFISDEGLLITNHHCGYDAIQSKSTKKHNYLKNGFWAEDREEELEIEDMEASILVRMQDVTDSIVPHLPDTLSESTRQSRIKSLKQKIARRAQEGNDYDTEVKGFFEDTRFYLFVFKTLKDVRLAGAPPESIGKFGGETDNWMWPRHTGDFALFRVYTGEDGEPADYAEDNEPYEPKHHFKISLDGVNKGDFTMAMGFPGSSSRYKTSYGIDMALSENNPARIKLRDKRLSIMKKYMDASEAVEIQYASKYASIGNYYKYFKGQNKALKKLNVQQERKKLESEFTEWVNEEQSRQKQYGDALTLIKEGYQAYDRFNLSRVYINEAGFAPEILQLAMDFMRFQRTLSSYPDSTELITKQANELKPKVKSHFKDYYKPIDKNVFSSLLQEYYESVDPEQHPSIFSMIKRRYRGSFSKFTQKVFRKSIFASQDKVIDFLENPDQKTLSKDLAFRTMESVLRNYYLNISPYISEAQNKIDRGKRKFLAGLQAMNPDTPYYPNANSTLRLTYGNVKGYTPKDGVYYKHYTTLHGIMEKKKPGSEEFDVPKKLQKLYKNKNYGRYGVNDTLYVNFISDKDITGGNSGSPVLGANGNLVGLAFDGNWEAMSSDIKYEPRLQRCINVDIRYVMFVIDKFAGADHLIREMDIEN